MLSQSHATNFLLSHRPVLGLACNGTHFVKIDWTLQEALMNKTESLLFIDGDRPLVPHTIDRVSAIFSGHMHWFQGYFFDSDEMPPQIVVGNGGTKLLPKYIPEHSADNLHIFGRRIYRAIVESNFGYSLLTHGNAGYRLTAHHIGEPNTQTPFWNVSLPHIRKAAHPQEMLHLNFNARVLGLFGTSLGRALFFSGLAAAMVLALTVACLATHRDLKVSRGDKTDA